MGQSFFQMQAVMRRRTVLVLAAAAVVYFLVFFAAAFIAISVGWIALGIYTYDLNVHSPVFGPFFAEVSPAVLLSARIAAGLGSALLLIAFIHARRNAVQEIIEDLKLREPDLEDRYHVRYRNLVHEMAIAAGLTEPPRAMVLPLLAMSACAAADKRSGAILAVTEGALSRLSRSQLQAVVAHEMAHIRNGDATIAAFACALMSPFSAVVEMMAKFEFDDPRAQGSEILAIMLHGVMRATCMSLSRGREIHADTAAVELTRNPLALAEALDIVGRGNHFIGGTAIAYAPIFIMDPAKSAVSDGSNWTANLFSSHPPLGARLASALAMAGMSMADFAEHRARGALDQLETEPADTTAGPPGEAIPILGELFAIQSASTDTGPCPRCGGHFVLVNYEGVPVEWCAQCRGFLVSMGRIERILARREKRFNTDQRTTAYDEAGSRIIRRPDEVGAGSGDALACPRCRGPMTRQYYNYQYLIVVDRCFGCDIVWFDATELETLQVFVEDTVPA